jgi:hypothetical protein
MRSNQSSSIYPSETRREFLKKTGLAAAAVAGAGLLPPPISASEDKSTVSIVTGSLAGQAAQHGIEKIIAALQDRRVSFEQVKTMDEAKGKMLIVAGLASDQKLFTTSLKQFCQSVPTSAQGLSIQKLEYKGKPVYAVAGSDDHGLMYAELDVADRIRWANDAESPLSEVRDTVEKPGVGTRRMTLYTFNRSYWESRFYDEAYWQRYLDTLAQNRFNILAVTFGYETGGFLAPCYPYFFDVPEFPDVKMAGITAEQQTRNVEALNRLIAMAHARGIDLTIGIWDHIYRGGVQAGGSPDGDAGLNQPKSVLVRGVTDENLIPYTQAAIKDFFKTFPGVDGIQFRMHDESGLKANQQRPFWAAVFQTVIETNPKLPLDFRAKGLTTAEIQSALDTGVNFFIDTKVWMEQLGLPFHPMHINPKDQSNRRHSYADLLVYPKKYNMDWELWNGGTSRVLLWGDPEYVRRFVECTHLYDSDSFGVDEPLTTKMQAQPHDLKPFDLLKPSARYYDYEFERYWHFFQLFGRIGYNANAPAEIWDTEFSKRFGADAGPILEDAMHRASWILPRIIASSYPYGGFPMTMGWAEKQHLGNLPDFAKGTLSDVQLFENFDEEAQLLLENGETAKVRPQETSRWLAQTADDVSFQIAVAEKKIGTRRGKEFDATVMDLRILVGLGRYHSQRILAAVSYRLFDRTKEVRGLDDAIAYERNAIAAWRQIVDAAGDTYASDLMMGRRDEDLCGHWRDELASLESGLAKLELQRKEAPSDAVSISLPRYVAADRSAVPVIFHQPVLTAPPLKPLTIRATAKSPAGIKWVQVLYRSVNQTKDYETLVMSPVDDRGNYEAVIPADKIDPQFDFMYFLQAMNQQRSGTMFPDFNKRTPYFVVRLERGE